MVAFFMGKDRACPAALFGPPICRTPGARPSGFPREPRLGKSSQCLLLTGPNAGGKTVVLKTLGLLALLVCTSARFVRWRCCKCGGGAVPREARCGIPIPGGEAPRVDFFEVWLMLSRSVSEWGRSNLTLMICTNTKNRIKPVGWLVGGWVGWLVG